MLMKFFLLQLLAFLLLLTSCGDGHTESKNSKYNQGLEELNSKNYSKAVSIFESLSIEHPENTRYKQLLADSYLGLGGFELFKFLISIENIITRSFNSEFLLLELREFTSAYVASSSEQRINLFKALEIYISLNDLEFADSREGRLKKGLVHIFLFTQSLKTFISQFETFELPPVNNPRELEATYNIFIRKYLFPIDEMIYHSFESYVSLRQTYNEIQKLIVEVDRSLFEVFGLPFQELQGDLTSMNIEKFVKLFIKYNPQLYKTIMKDILQTCERREAYLKITLIEKAIRENYKNHQLQGMALRVVNELRKYIENHQGDICDSDILQSI